MTQKIKVLWVEDETTDRKADKERIEDKQKDLKITLIHPRNIDAYLSTDWDLFLIDYYLNLQSLHDNNSADPDELRYNYLGLTADSIIREKYPDIPIFCMSSKYEDLLNGPEYFSIHNSFDKFLSLNEIQNNGEKYLYFDALDYRLIRESKVCDLSRLFKLLNAPEEIQTRLQLVLPSSVKNGLYTKSDGNSLAFAKWVNDILLKVPGFLYDSLNAATFFGIRQEAFDEKSEKLTLARYNGIFNKSNNPFWWKTRLLDLIHSYPLIDSCKNRIPCSIGPKIFKIKKGQQTKCIVCQKEYPEIIGYNLTDSSDKVPVHIKCSRPNPKFKGELYFDEFRGFTTNLG